MICIIVCNRASAVSSQTGPDYQEYETCWTGICSTPQQWPSISGHGTYHLQKHTAVTYLSSLDSTLQTYGKSTAEGGHHHLQVSLPDVDFEVHQECLCCHCARILELFTQRRSSFNISTALVQEDDLHLTSQGRFWMGNERPY